MSNKQKSVTKYNGTIIKTRKELKVNYGIDPKKILEIKSGIINTSFLVDCGNNKYVFRVYLSNNKSIKGVEKELELCKKLKGAGLPIPIVYKNIRGNEVVKIKLGGKFWFAVLFEYLPGRHLKSTDKSLIDEVSKLHAKMHVLLQSKISKEDHNFTSQITNLIDNESALSNKKLKVKKQLTIQNSLNSIRQQVIDELNNKKGIINSLPKGYCHLDYDSSNILTNSRHISGIIDFDDVTMAPFIADVAFSLWWWLFFNKFDQKILNSYLKSYQIVRNLKKEEYKYMYLFLRARNVFLAYILFVNQDKINFSKLKRVLLFDKWIKYRYEKNSIS